MAYISIEDVRGFGASSSLSTAAPGVPVATLQAAIDATLEQIDFVTGEQFRGGDGETIRIAVPFNRGPRRDLRLPRFRAIASVLRQQPGGGPFEEVPMVEEGADEGYFNWEVYGVHREKHGPYFRKLRAHNPPVWPPGEYRIMGDWGWLAADVPANIRWAALTQSNFMVLHADSTGGVSGAGGDFGIQVGAFFWHPMAFKIVSNWTTGYRGAGA